MDKSQRSQKQLLVAVLAPLLVGLSACGGGDEDDGPQEVQGLVTIEFPATSPTFGPTSQDTIAVSGSRSMFVKTVTWSNSAGGSGTGTLTEEPCVIVGIPLLCNTEWSMSVPLAIGTNTITVTGTDPRGFFGRDTISITRI
jgi:hypothetical protein